MSMFPFADDWMSPQARENPFLALMPGMEPLQKTTEDWLRGMGEIGRASCRERVCHRV